MTTETRQAIENLTRDTEQLYEKPYLMQAIASHLKVTYKIPRAEAEAAVAEYFTEQERGNNEPRTVAHDSG